MKLLINTSNLKKGGALQVALSFLDEIKSNTAHIFYVVLSKELEEQADLTNFPDNFEFIKYSLKPKLFKSLLGMDSFLTNIEKLLKPDCVFTIFGPAYWTSSVNHVLGFADGWCYNPDSEAFRVVSFLKKLKLYAIIKLKNYRIKRESTIIIVETDDAKTRISSLLRIPLLQIIVVGNTYHGIYNNTSYEHFKLNANKSEFKLVTICANYPHKNLKIINAVSNHLKERGLKVHFYLTIDEFSFVKMFPQSEDYVTNLGPIPIKYCPSIYQQCDALFLPSLLETFTSSYPEAMKIGLPILTSDLSFARETCGKAAEYFDPMNPNDIADKIEIIVKDQKRRQYLIDQGKKRLMDFETSTSRANKYLEICQAASK